MTTEATPGNVPLIDQLGPASEAQPLLERLRNAGRRGDDDADKAADEIERLLAEKAKTLDAVRILNGLFSRNVMAMQAALIDKVLRGPHEGWAWIINTLEGPGLLPDLDDARKAGGAQAWFDAELAAEEARVAGLGAQRRS